MSKVRKKKINTSATATSAKKKQKIVDLGWKGNDDENIDSEEEDEEQNRAGKFLEDEDVEDEEALDARKVRLAREYLQKLEGGDSDDSSADDESDDDRQRGQEDEHYDRIGLKLQRERLKREGGLKRAVADKVSSSLQSIRQSLPNPKQTTTTARIESIRWREAGHIRLLRGHDLTPTCVALQSSGQMAISGSKDHSVFLWDVEQGKRSVSLCPHWSKEKDTEVSRTQGEVLSVACSDDGRYAAVGRRDSTVAIFDVRSGKNSLIKTFTGHKAAVTCLGFRTQSLQLFSGSEDRCIR